jgi:molybdopterin-guanine dinucleotide biosynthesis protein A
METMTQRTPSGSPVPVVYDALILAGGRGTRLSGRDKGWIMWDGLPLIEHTLARLKAQTPAPTRILISANRNIDAYQQTGHVVVTDERPDFMGPLAGVEAGLMRCKKNPLLVVPCDTPLLPENLYERLSQALAEHADSPAAFATTSDGPQPLCCLLRPSIAGSLGKYLDVGHGSVLRWLEQSKAQRIEFNDARAFSNFNHLEMFDTPRNLA